MTTTAAPLVTPEQVWALTGRPEDDKTAPAVEHAVAVVEAATRRRFRLHEVTEQLDTFRLSSGSRVLRPTHRPVVEVTAPTGVEVATSALLRVAAGVPDRVVVTYTAGWTPDTFPADLAQVVAQVAATLADQMVSRPDAGQVNPAFDTVAVDGVGGQLRDPGPDGLERLAPGSTPVVRRWRAGT